MPDSVNNFFQLLSDAQPFLTAAAALELGRASAQQTGTTLPAQALEKGEGAGGS